MVFSLPISLIGAPLPPWRHRDSFVVDASLQYFAQHILPLAGTVHSSMVPYPSVPLGEFGVVSFGRERSWYPLYCPVPSRVEMFGKTVHIMMEHYCKINGETMVSLSPSLYDCPASLFDGFLIWTA